MVTRKKGQTATGVRAMPVMQATQMGPLVTLLLLGVVVLGSLRSRQHLHRGSQCLRSEPRQHQQQQQGGLLVTGHPSPLLQPGYLSNPQRLAPPSLPQQQQQQQQGGQELQQPTGRHRVLLFGLPLRRRQQRAGVRRVTAATQYQHHMHPVSVCVGWVCASPDSRTTL